MVAVKAALVAVKRAVIPENLPLKLFGAGSDDVGLILSAIPEDSYFDHTFHKSTVKDEAQLFILPDCLRLSIRTRRTDEEATNRTRRR
jgi:hypothetical protein